ncbi:dephospho-CoA kinase [Mycoplasmopsis pulmonis]|uniref:dephospho-CoA kinase n=1 Tax=Mycoplasmopsis pulmonis TaxID=2107 RepID=UPI001004F9E0|nr:dephospho-CoA kinase [Mycoplasmopsis pulmonis]VEU68486.1 putative dephospho-CoA kinase [Mycoplasmopsis pulmonis]
MIAITGKAGVGKTTFLKKMEKKGYKILYSDNFFNQDYEKGYQSYQLIKDNLGQDFVNDQRVDKKRLKNWIKEDLSNLDRLEKLIYPLLKTHLEQNFYDFVEIPVLGSKNVDFYPLFSKIYNIEISESQRLEQLKKRGVDNSDISFFESINKGVIGKKVVNISLENLEKIEKF